MAPFHVESRSSPVIGKEESWVERNLTKSTGKGRTATATRNYPIFVLPSAVLAPTPHCQASHAYSLCGSSLTFTHFYLCCFSSLLCTSPFCRPPAPPHTLSCPVSLIHFTLCCPQHTQCISCVPAPSYTCRHAASVPLVPFTGTHKDRPVQTSAYWRWSHFQ